MSLIDVHLVVEESAERLAFRHALTRQAIYAQLLARERQALHGNVVKAIEDLFGGSTAPRTTWRTWRITPTRRAIGRGSATTRRAWVTERSACTRPRSPSNTSDAHSKRRARSANHHRDSSIAPAPRRTRCGASSNHAETDYRAALEAARGDGDRDAEWQGLLDLGFVWLARDYARAGIFFEQALALAEELGDASLIAAQPEPRGKLARQPGRAGARARASRNAHWPPFVSWATRLASPRRSTSSASRC